ncbi:Branched-chain amino acid ABC transporter, amino acid-binding protein (TC 3.A.1.4.1) [[Actinomadura] parvosata subsp. kistnae]|uniref:Branched chain amino acid ABC transporter substrate-binding protein n=1 Tax=[Actinomadura] parvosata subsp. kistnae TaxID=1909395 RepID=A0A1V0A8C9_9ACTN|nr:branched-chain amino acid ABC transporter substrate-binding protein [Nonomuraea sp. ATCC 55076]AQZ66412.1 branched chain amino acid ABC transporter substrate-binding protein [Nonomuraea sp. ATCC 55076]SPL95537.1 Branched-chain amino acid ABC transporter, amino acid-binding protein (TC 3.A.1.4.1) [Actinomadura parvosata subsp. kistnae]
MTRKSNGLLAALVATGVALGAGACGADKIEAAGGAGGCDTSKGRLVVGVIAPMSGKLSAIGLGIRNSVQLAVEQANASCAVKGYQLAMDAQDDEANPDKGAAAAQRFADDPNVVGIVGSYNSGVARAIQPKIATAKLLQISPGNTDPALTRGADFATAPKRQYDNYFRVVGTDDLQGPFNARYLVEKEGKKKLAIITDGKAVGESMATEFAKEAERLGAQVVIREKVNENDSDFSSVLTKVKGVRPDAIFVGSEYHVAGPLSKQAKDLGLDVPISGNDGLFDPQFIALGGKEGDVATSVGAPIEKLDSGKGFVAAYKKKGFAEGFGGFGSFAYDAANVIVSSVGKVTAKSDWTGAMEQREALIRHVQAYRTDAGANGTIGFDQYGDSVNKMFTVYKVTSGAWKDVLSDRFEAK